MKTQEIFQLKTNRTEGTGWVWACSWYQEKKNWLSQCFHMCTH